MAVHQQPRGTIQRGIPTQDGNRLWLVSWARGRGPRAVSSPLQFETGQAVTLTPDGQLVRLR